MCLSSVVSLATVVMSLSSGAENMLFKGKEVEVLNNILKCRSLQATHFTETEAKKYLKLIEGDLTLNDVRSVSKTNLYLLSHACKGVSFNKFAMVVNGLVDRFISVNLSDVKSEPTSVLSFQVTKSVRACWKFVYYAINGAVLTDDELTHYEGTWLDQHNLTMRYKKASALTAGGHQQPAEVAINSHQQLSSSSQNEEDVKDEIKCDQPPQATTGQNIALKWNFPTMGHKFIRVLEEYVKRSTEESLITVCQKEPGFAGFWFEAKFFDFLRESKTLHVEYVNCSAGTENSAALFFDSVYSLCSPASHLTRRTVFELRSLHPLIDSVGILQENSTEWLVFIQVSLQRYHEHKKKMSSIFCSPSSTYSRPIELKGKGNITLYTYYKRLCATRTDLNVMLLYVSPKEDATSPILPELQEAVSSKLFANLHVAVLSTKSKFYSTLDEFKSYL